MHLHDLMGWPGPMTHRQFVVWQEWLKQQWNKPSRSDHYAMQISAHVIQANSKKGRRIRLSQMEIPFEFKDGKEKMERDFVDPDKETADVDLVTNLDDWTNADIDEVEAQLRALKAQREQDDMRRRTEAAKKHHIAAMGGKVRVVRVEGPPPPI